MDLLLDFFNYHLLLSDFSSSVFLLKLYFCYYCFVVQWLSHFWLFVTPWLLCPSLSPRISSNSCSLSQWCHPTISSSVIPFSSCPQSFTGWRFFAMSWLFASGGQSIGASASSSVLPMNIQGSFPLGFTGLISLLPKGLSRVFSSTTIQKHHFFGSQPSLWPNSHICTWLLEKTISSIIRTFVGKVMSLLLNTLSRFVISFLPRSKSLLISWLQSLSAVILKPK